MLDAEIVVEQLRNLPLEAVEHREPVLADRDHEVRRRVGSIDGKRELLVERPFASFGRVIEEVLLELVEDDQNR